MIIMDADNWRLEGHGFSYGFSYQVLQVLEAVGRYYQGPMDDME